MSKCKVEGCGNDVLSIKLCSKHYYANYNHGDPLIYKGYKPVEFDPRIVDMKTYGFSMRAISRVLDIPRYRVKRVLSMVDMS